MIQVDRLLIEVVRHPNLGRVGHADILGSHGGTLGQLLARYKFVIVAIAEVPQRLKLFVVDLIIQI